MYAFEESTYLRFQKKKKKLPKFHVAGKPEVAPSLHIERYQV